MKFTFGKISTRGLGIFKAKELPEGTIVRRTDGWYQKSGGEWKRLPHEHAALKQGPHLVPEIDPSKVLDEHLDAMELDGWDEMDASEKNEIKEEILEDVHALFHHGDNKKFWKEWAKTHDGKPDAMHKEVVEAVAARMRETAKPPVLAKPVAPAPQAAPAPRGIQETLKVPKLEIVPHATPAKPEVIPHTKTEAKTEVTHPLNAESLAYEHFWSNKKQALDKITDELMKLGVKKENITFEDRDVNFRYEKHNRAYNVKTLQKFMYVNGKLVSLERLKPMVKQVVQREMLPIDAIVGGAKVLANLEPVNKPEPLKLEPKPAVQPKLIDPITQAIDLLLTSKDPAIKAIAEGINDAYNRRSIATRNWMKELSKDTAKFQSMINEYFASAGNGATAGGMANFIDDKRKKELEENDKKLESEQLKLNEKWKKINDDFRIHAAGLTTVSSKEFWLGMDRFEEITGVQPLIYELDHKGNKEVLTQESRLGGVVIGAITQPKPGSIQGGTPTYTLHPKLTVEANPKEKEASALPPAMTNLQAQQMESDHPGAPIGAIHKWKDGWYEKVGEGEWKPVLPPAERGIKDEDVPAVKLPKPSKKATKGKNAVTPSDNMTLKQLLSIKEDNYIGASGQEYIAEEVDYRIHQLSAKKADREVEKKEKTEAELYKDLISEIKDKLSKNQMISVSHDSFWDGITKYEETSAGLRPSFVKSGNELVASVDGSLDKSSRIGSISTDHDGSPISYKLNEAYFNGKKTPIPGTVAKPLEQKEKKHPLNVAVPKGFEYLGMLNPGEHFAQSEKTGDVFVGDGESEATWTFHTSKKEWEKRNAAKWLAGKENAKVNEVIEKLDKEAGKEPLIVGKTWEEIQAMQQKNYKPKTVDMSVSGKKEATKEDIALLEKHGEAGLKEKEFHGVLDRLETSGLLKKEEPAPTPDPEPTVKEMTPKTVAQAITTENTSKSVIPSEVESLPDVDLKLIPKLNGRTPSKYQMAVFKFIKHGKGNGIVDAVAGSGKSSTIEMAYDLLSPEDKLNTRFLAFNKHIEKELGSRGLPAKTMHAEGFAAWRNAMKGARVAVENNKVLNLLNEDLPGWANKEMRLAVSDLVGKAKIHGLVPKAALIDNPKLKSLMADDEENWVHLMQRFDIQVPAGETMGSVIKIARSALADSIQQKDVIDFSDMIYMPLIHDVEMPKYKFLFVDELQDMSPLQHKLISKMLDKNGRFIGVGDVFQSMYGFSGADVHGVEHAAKTFNATKIPLSICYRCPKSVIKLAQKFVPHIEAAPWATEGEINQHGKDFDNKMFLPNDMILCRTNAPLVQLTYQLIKDRIPCKMLGRDIGAGLAKIIKKQKAGTVPELISKLDAWVAKEVQIARRKNPDADVSFIQDKYDTIMTFVDNTKATTPEGIAAEIEDMFADEDTKGLVRLSSIHKAKGLESDNVYILNDHLMPGKWAKTPDDLQQERNIQYVAYTRPKKKLGFIEMEKRSKEDIQKSVLAIFRASSRGLSDDMGITKSRITISSVLNIGRKYASR